MKTVSFFHKETGLLSPIQLTVSDASLIALNTPEDHIAIDGHHDHLSKRVDIENEDGLEPVYTLTDWIPPSPSAYHDVWNPTTKRWQLSVAATDKIARGNAARARIAELESLQHEHVRKFVIEAATMLALSGNRVSSINEIRVIHNEIKKLEEQL